jgi:hypothetical protein
MRKSLRRTALAGVHLSDMEPGKTAAAICAVIS